jgi:putative endopeptidase
MNHRSTLRPTVLAVALLSTLALGACDKQGAGEAQAAATADAPRFTLDEAKLPPVNRFQLSDLD